MRYTDIVSKGSRNPVTGNLPIFLFLFFTPFFQICILNEQAPFSLPPA